MKKIFARTALRIEVDSWPGLILQLGASISILWAVYFALVTISIPYQIELREGTALVLTKLLLGRENPFILDNQPMAMNNYGMGYNLAVLPFAAWFGNTLLVHRSVTFVFILFASLICILTVWQVKRMLPGALTCGAFVVIGLITRGGIGAFPSAMGTCLFLMAVFLPFLKSFNTASLVFSALLSLAAFYTKAYFVFGFAIVASYLYLFISKKKGILFSLFFIVGFGVLFFVIRFLFPLYFINTIVGNIANTSWSLEHAFDQLGKIGIYFFPSLVLMLYHAGRQYIMEWKKRSSINIGQGLIQFSMWERPLLAISFDYFFYSFSCSLLAFIFILGPHIGSYLNYAYQLLVPTFFCWFFRWFEPRGKSGVFYALLVIFNLCFWEEIAAPARMLEQKNSANWAELFSYLQPSLNILNSPVVTSRVVDVQSNPVDSGQTTYYYNIQPYADNNLIGPSYDIIYTDGYRYIKAIDKSIENRKFDLIVTSVEKTPFYHSKLIGENYSLIRELVVDMPQTDERWTVQIWKPLGKK